MSLLGTVILQSSERNIICPNIENAVCYIPINNKGAISVMVDRCVFHMFSVCQVLDIWFVLTSWLISTGLLDINAYLFLRFLGQIYLLFHKNLYCTLDLWMFTFICLGNCLIISLIYWVQLGLLNKISCRQADILHISRDCLPQSNCLVNILI